MDLSNIFGSNYGKDLYSTGSYGKDVGVGLLSSLNYALNQPGKYYVKANYRGNGLADTGLGYMANQNYTNPYDMMNALTSSMYGGNRLREQNGEYGNNDLFNVLGKLSTLGGGIGNWAAEQRGRILPTGKLLFSNMFNRLGDFGSGFRRDELENGITTFA